MSRWQKPRLLISEQVVCLCTTAVTQTSNTNIFSNSVPQHGAFSPSLCSQQLSQQAAPFTFQQSILVFIFGAETLPTVEFTAWTLVLILWLSWATHSFIPIPPIIPFFLGIPLVFSQNAEMFTPAENPTRQNRAVRNELAMSIFQLENTGYILLWRPQRSCDQRRYLCKSVIGSIN